MADQNQMNIDQIVQMCQIAVNDIIQAVGGVGNLLQDDGRMALIQAIAQRLTQLGADVDFILGPQLALAYHQGMTDADALLSQAGKDVTVTGVNKQIHLAGVQSIVADTMADMSASFRTALIMGISDIDGILAQVNQDIATGMIKGDASGYTAKLVEQSFAKSGMTSFVTKDGKRLPLDFYAQTVTRTKYRVAHTTGATNRYKESGVYHVKVDEHSPTCKHCARFQGMVIALHEDHAQGFPVAGSGDAKLPPYHPNCQHTVRPFVMEGHSQSDINNEKKKWRSFDPDQDMRSQNEKEFYKTEQGIRRKARQELKDYNQLKATLGDDAPKNIGAYRRAKRKNDDSWKALQTKYKEKMDISNADGPTDPGTPRKRKGSKNGTSGPSTLPTSGSKSSAQGKTKEKKKTTTQAKQKATKKPTKTPDKVDTTPPVQDVQSHLTDADRRSNEKFDGIIDGIEFGDMKKTSKHLIDKSEYTNGSVTVGVRTNIGCGGYCSPQVMMKKVYITDMVIEKNLYKFVPMAHQNQTIFHEFYHANMNRLPMAIDPQTDRARLRIGERRWTSLEETATETAGIFMTNRAGIKYHGEAPAYSNHLIDNLPRMKQMDEFAHCETLDDFGQVFMKYRFDPDHRTADWTDMDNRIKSQTKEHDTFKYIQNNYKDWVVDNKEMIQDKIFDTLSQQKAGKEVQFKEHIWNEIERGMNGRMNNFYQMAVGIAFNTPGMGVKLP